MSFSLSRSYLGERCSGQQATSPLSPHKEANAISEAPLRIRGGGQGDASKESPRKDSMESDKENAKERPSMTMEKSMASSMWSAGEPGEGILYANMLRDMERQKREKEAKSEAARAATSFKEADEENAAKPTQRESEQQSTSEKKSTMILEQEEEDTAKHKAIAEVIDEDENQQQAAARKDSLFGDKEEDTSTDNPSDTSDTAASKARSMSKSAGQDVMASLLAMSQEDMGYTAVATNLEEEILASSAGNMRLNDEKASTPSTTKTGKEDLTKDTSKYHSPSDSIMSPTTQKLSEFKAKNFDRSSNPRKTLFGHKPKLDKKDDDAEVSAASGTTAGASSASESTRGKKE